MSLEILKEEGFELDEEIKDGILNHGTDKNPKTKFGKIMQITDKISIIDRNILKILLEQQNIEKNDISFFEKIFNSAIKMLNELKNTIKKPPST